MAKCCSEPTHCKDLCRKHYMQVYRQRSEQVAKRSEYNRKHYLKNIEWYKARNRSEKARVAVRALSKKWREDSPEYRRQKARSEYAKYRANNVYRANKRRALLLKATPSWVNQSELREIYKNCPPGYHVDHIIPLQGKNICGLHVPANLQYLPARENLKKGNKVL